MVIYTMVNGKITVDQAGEYMKTKALDTNMLEIGRKIKRMALGNKRPSIISMKDSLLMIRSRGSGPSNRMVYAMTSHGKTIKSMEKGKE